MSARRLRTLLLASAAAALVVGPPAAAEAALPAAPAVDNTNRTSARNAYLAYHEAALKVPTGWTGSVSTCTAGTMSADARAAALTSVNYVRRMVGLQPATFDATWSARAQKSALVIEANRVLTHTPASTSRCWTADAYNAAKTGNIALGYPTAASTTDAYMSDHGGTNASTVGHRRWILDPRVTRMGMGQTASANTMKVHDGSLPGNPYGTPAYVAWPDAGYVPSALLPKENVWTFSASDGAVDMQSAVVSVRSRGVTIPTTTVRLPNGYGKPAVSFKPSHGYVGGSDRSYTITVSGMKRGTTLLAPYTYTTTLFDARYALSPQTVGFGLPSAVYKGASSTMAATSTSGLPVTYSTSTPGTCSVSGTKVTYLAEGVCTVTARQGGNATWAAASTTRSTLVWLTTKKSNVITWAQPTTAAKGTTARLGATASSGLPVTYVSATPAVCTVAGGYVTHREPGTCTVTAQQAGSTTVNRAANVTRSWTVTGLFTNSITWNPPTSVAVGATIARNPVAKSGSGLFAYSMSTTNGACAFGTGTIVTRAKGTCTVTVSQSATSTWTGASITRTITVS